MNLYWQVGAPFLTGTNSVQTYRKVPVFLVFSLCFAKLVKTLVSGRPMPVAFIIAPEHCWFCCLFYLI